MTDAVTAEAPAAAPEPVPAVLSDSEAVELLGRRREQPRATPDAGAGEQESAAKADAAPPAEEVRGETETGTDGSAGEPPIDPPRSWKKEAKDAFRNLPAELQRYIADSERSREADFLRRQNEATDTRKAADAERTAAEQARKQYEASLPGTVNLLLAELQRDFPDVKDMAAYQALGRTDPARYIDLQSRLQAIQAYQGEAARAEQEANARRQADYEAFAAGQLQKLVEKAPEFGDPKKVAELQAEAVTVLTDIGFSPEELESAWNRGAVLSLRDHRLQLLVRDAIELKRARAQLRAAPPKPVPVPARPGSAPAKGEAAASRIQEAKDNLARTGSVDAAVALLRARRAG